MNTNRAARWTSSDGGKIEQQTRLFDSARGGPGPCAPRKRRPITAISPIPIFCRSSSIRPGRGIKNSLPSSRREAGEVHPPVRALGLRSGVRSGIRRRPFL